MHHENLAAARGEVRQIRFVGVNQLRDFLNAVAISGGIEGQRVKCGIAKRLRT